ncbi:MAG: hypothetical protein ACAI38_02420 [Myxococcota bacterium]|nr:hypothetical protein [Myxococcota bacterium]
MSVSVSTGRTGVSAPVLALLPVARNTAGNQVLVAQALARRGVLDGLTRDQAQVVVAFTAEKLGAQFDAERDLNGGRLAEHVADKIVGKDEFEKAQKKSNRKSWWVAGGFFAGGMLASGALNIGVDLAFKAINQPWAASVNTALSPALFVVSAALVGAVTGLFVEKLTTPVAAWFTRLSFKGSPIKSHLDTKLGASLIDAYNGANQVDGRVFSAASTLSSLIVNLEGTLSGDGGVRSLIRQARAGGADKKALLQEAGEQLGGKLIQTEVAHFHLDPMFTEIFRLVHASVGGIFRKLDPADQDTIIESALAYVREARPNEPDGQRPDTGKAIETYFAPFLTRLVKGVPKPTGGASAS